MAPLIYLGNQPHYLILLFNLKLALLRYFHYPMTVTALVIKHFKFHFLIKIYNFMQFLGKSLINYLQLFDFLLNIAIFSNHQEKYHIQQNSNDQAFSFSNLLSYHYYWFESTIIWAFNLKINYQVKFKNL